MRTLLLLLVLSVPALAQSDKAVVYVYSYSAIKTLGTVKKPVFVDGKEIAQIRPERYFIALLEPGRHALHLKNKKLGGVEQEFKAGETYYVRLDWRSGAVLSPAGFVIVPKENGAFDIKQLKPVDKKNVKDDKTAVLSLN